MAVAVPILLFLLAWAARLLGGQDRLTLTVDSVYYALAAQRFAEGRWAETLSAIWLPGMPLAAAPLVWIGLSPTNAILWLNAGSSVATIGMLYLLTKRVFGDFQACVASLILATNSRLIQETSTIGSDCLFLALSLLAFLFVYQKKKSVMNTVLAAGLVWIRLPGILLGGWIAGLSIRERKFSPGIAWLASLITLCIIYYWRTGHFSPTLSPLINHLYMQFEWLGKDPDGFCRLYDGRNTFLGDFFFLDPGAAVPTSPDLPMGDLLSYRFVTVIRYLIGLLRVVPVFTLPFVFVGLWKVLRDSRYLALGRVGILWMVFATAGSLGTTVVPRYFLPAFPFASLFAAIGVADFSRRYRLRTWILPAMILSLQSIQVAKDTGLRSAWRNFNQASPQLAGDYIRKTHGPGAKIITRWNFASAIRSEGTFRIPPCESDDEVVRYLQRKGMDYWITWREVPSVVRRLEQRGVLKKEWDGGNEIAWKMVDAHW